MFSNLPNPLPLALRSPRLITAVTVSAATAAGVAWYLLRRPIPSPEQMERQRRDFLSSMGRITDGTITDASCEPDDPTRTPRVLVYDYRIAGVSYECAQDVSTLAEHVRDVRVDLPVQVRYDLHNPENSIVVAESWSGLRIDHLHPTPPESLDSPSIASDQPG